MLNRIARALGYTPTADCPDIAAIRRICISRDAALNRETAANELVNRMSDLLADRDLEIVSLRRSIAEMAGAGKSPSCVVRVEGVVT